jgi:hypothetical protein
MRLEWALGLGRSSWMRDGLPKPSAGPSVMRDCPWFAKPLETRVRDSFFFTLANEVKSLAKPELVIVMCRSPGNSGGDNMHHRQSRPPATTVVGLCRCGPSCQRLRLAIQRFLVTLVPVQLGWGRRSGRRRAESGSGGLGHRWRSYPSFAWRGWVWCGLARWGDGSGDT